MATELPAGAPVKRLKELDVLRAVAVFLVLGRHMVPPPPETWGPVSVVLNLWLRGGWIGVDLFFVLSGFLVSGLLFKEQSRYGKIQVMRFFIRRGFKIYPAFYFMTLTSILVYYAYGYQFPLSAILSEVFFVQNYGPAMWNHTWTLAIEEHFYLFIGLLLFFSARRKSARPFAYLPVFFVAFAFLLQVLRITEALLFEYSHEIHLFPSHLRFDSLLFGVLLSYFYRFHRQRLTDWVNRRRRLVGLVSFCMVLPPFFMQLETEIFIYTTGLLFLYFGFGGLLLLSLLRATESDRAPSITKRTVARIGFYSYSIYLWHMPVKNWLLPWTNGLLGRRLPYFVELAYYLVSAVLVGVVLAIAIETPFLRLRDKFFPSRSRAL